MEEPVIKNAALASTARWTAAARARENEQAERLFFDPWALALAGESGRKWLERLAGSPFGTTPMVIRTRYFDDFLKDAVRKRRLRQVVLLAAGLDTRAYRLEWPVGTRLFELDQAAVMDEKEQILLAAGAKPACIRISVAADLTQPWGEALTAGGFDAKEPAVWLMEGFLFYLAPGQIPPMFDAINRLSAVGSRVGFDIINQQTLTSPYTRAWIEMQAKQGAPWTGWLDDPRGFMAGRGWRARLTQPGAPDANYGRWLMPVIPLDAPDLPHNWYVTATKVKPHLT